MARPRIALLAAVMLAGAPAAAAERIDAAVTLNPVAGTISGRALIDTKRSRLSFRLAPGLAATAVSVNGRPLRVRDDGDGHWSARLDGSDAEQVVVEWQGRLPPLDPEDVGLGLSADGGFLPAGTAWLPETNADAFAWRLEVTLPQPQVAVATGRLVSEERSDGSYRAIFAAEPPAEPPSLFTGPFEVTERTADGRRLRAYLHHEVGALADGLLAAAERHIARFDRAIGDYPHEAFAIVTTPLPVGLGFPGLTYVGRQVVPLPFFAPRSLAHEILHDWWGNGVRVAYERGNWAEALTTYMADHALAAEDAPAEARRMRQQWLRDFAALPRDRDVPLRAFTAKAHDAAQVVGYGKGAFVFHMLRHEIGDDAFAAGLRRFWSEDRFRRAGWDDLRNAFEAASGRDLGWFFAQWLERPGAPRLSLEQAEADGTSVTVGLRQHGTPWRLSVPVRIETANGTVERTVPMSGASATVALDVPGSARALAVDPDHHLFRRLHPDETPPILRDVTLDAATRPVILTDDRDSAIDLANRMLDQPTPPLAPAAALEGEAPLLVIGTTEAVAAFLEEARLSGPPPAAAERGTARAWVATAGPRRSRAVAAAPAAALRALLRPLPHYRGDGWLVFEGRRMVARGQVTVSDSPLRVRFE